MPNISSDPEDGIGAGRTVDLANALLSGVAGLAATSSGAEIGIMISCSM